LDPECDILVSQNSCFFQICQLVPLRCGVRDTAVAEDLDGASKIAYEGRQRRRVVTLAGQLIETSGTMSGGGNKPKGGRMRMGTAAPVVGMDAEESAAAVAEVGLYKLTHSLKAPWYQPLHI
jgi:hypothetical protein